MWAQTHQQNSMDAWEMGIISVETWGKRRCSEETEKQKWKLQTGKAQGVTRGLWVTWHLNLLGLGTEEMVSCGLSGWQGTSTAGHAWFPLRLWGCMTICSLLALGATCGVPWLIDASFDLCLHLDYLLNYLPVSMISSLHLLVGLVPKYFDIYSSLICYY